MTGVTVLVPAVVGVAAVVALAACGGHGAVQLVGVRDGTGSPPPGASGTNAAGPSPPTGTRSAAQLLQGARDAFASALSVHVTGTAVRGADAYVLDVRLAGSAGATATIETAGQTVDVTRIGDVVYVGGDVAFWLFLTGSEAKARQLAGSHVRTRVSDPSFTAYEQFTQPSTYAAVLPDPGEPATLTGPATIRGIPVVGVRDGAGSTLYVAATGPAYPLRLDGLAAGQVVFLDFSGYGKPVPLRAPSTRPIVDPGRGS